MKEATKIIVKELDLGCKLFFCFHKLQKLLCFSFYWTLSVLSRIVNLQAVKYFIGDTGCQKMFS